MTHLSTAVGATTDAGYSENMTTVLTMVAMLLCITACELFAGTRREGYCWVLLIGTVVCVATLTIASLVALGRRRRRAFLGLGAATGGAWWIVMSFSPGGDRIIARTTAPDGIEMCILQSFTGEWAEPYRVSFYYRRPGQPWGWFYYEHEDMRWWFGSINLTTDGRRAEILRFVSPVAHFDLQKEAFTIVRINRRIVQAQRWMPAGWEPENELARR
jgi:hypothetical protein